MTSKEQKLRDYYMEYIEGDDKIPHPIVNEFKRDVEAIRLEKLEKLAVKLNKRNK